MPRFSSLLAEGMKHRGHQVEIWTAPVLLGLLGRYFAPSQKWLGYIDQFLIFPLVFQWKLRKLPENTLFIFSDQALGPWVPLVANRPHLIHCHDFLALRGALGELPGHFLGFTGRLYQHFIRWGFRKGKFFVSVSTATQNDLLRFLTRPVQFSAVVYNPLNAPFAPLPKTQAFTILESQISIVLEKPFLMHIGNNWYKNRLGVLQIFEQLCQDIPQLQLIMVSVPSPDLQQWLLNNPSVACKVHFFQGISFEQLQALYSLALALVFPSLYEGFGWPILEALACGCPVLTCNSAPMNEVGREAAFYLPPYPQILSEQIDWAQQGARQLKQIYNLSNAERLAIREKGIAYVTNHFSQSKALDAYEYYYKHVLQLTQYSC